MKGKIFRQVFVAVMAFFLVSCCVLGVTGYRYMSNAYTMRLWKETDALSAYANEHGGASVATASIGVQERVTWIAADGQVLYDSEKSPTSMDNQSSREEVQEALSFGKGESRRLSSAGNTKYLYMARRLDDGSVIRVAASSSSGFTMMVNLFIPFLVSLLLALAVSVLLALGVSRSVIRPINEMDINGPDERDVYPELQPLVQRINGQNRQIRRQMDELKEEHERQDMLRREFTANVSHELKTPLTSISGYAELMRDGLAKPEDTCRFSGRIYDECQRLITLVEDILKLSRMESGVHMPEKRPVDLYHLCSTVLERLEQAALNNQVTMKLCGESAVVFGAESILYEMIYNLCDNAIKYNRPNGQVIVRISETADSVQLTVTDTGIGIPEEDINRIFERFYRVDKSHSKEVGGTGLGLSIVKHGAVYHRAQLSVDSALDKGTTITLCFPIAGEAAEE